MLVTAKQIRSCSLEAVDGTVGHVTDLLFDDLTWTIRYLEVDTGRWLPGRRVILSPEVIQAANYEAHRLNSPLMKEQVKHSPPIESELPVSRQKEVELAAHYAWGAYWDDAEAARREDRKPIHLRSAGHVTGYHIRAIDGEIGHVADFIIDDRPYDLGGWAVRYLVVDTRNFLPGRHVLVPPLWAESIDWDSQQVKVGLDRESIEASPEYEHGTPPSREYEDAYYDHYGWPKYWKGEKPQD